MFHHLEKNWYSVNPKLSVQSTVSDLIKASNFYKCNVTKPKAIIVPHASYYYSGLCAASAYNSLDNIKENISKIFILSTWHSGKGFCIPEFTNDKLDLKNVLGNQIKLGFKTLSMLYQKYNKPDLVADNTKFETEHSIEIQIPLIYHTFKKNVELIPILVGNNDLKSLQNFGNILSKYDDEKTFWIISGDMLHVDGNHTIQHFNYIIKNNITNTINEITDRFIKHLLRPNPISFNQQIHNMKNFGENNKGIINKVSPTICGRYAILLWLIICKNMNLTGNIANYYHSKQVSPDGIFPFNNIDKIDDSIVSYLSVVYSQSRHQKNNSVYFSPYESQTLILLVKNTLYQEWKLSSRYMTPLLSVPNFNIKKGVFITFKTNNDLRGCIGTFDSNKNTIIDNIRFYTLQSAFNDTRSGLTKDNPITLKELENPQLKISITILSEKKKLPSSPSNNREAIKEWKIGKDGIIITNTNNNNSAIFLPSVPTEQGWDKIETIKNLSLKAEIQQNLEHDNWTSKQNKIYYIPGLEIDSTYF
jgi:AmmeMemoRadiSam system protein B/AmmeMemoRadiSam system protein A